MQKGDFGKRAVMKYLCIKCRWGGCGGWKCLKRSVVCLGRHASWRGWKYEIPPRVGLCLGYSGGSELCQGRGGQRDEGGGHM